MIGKMNDTGEHLISKELRYMRICFVILIIILIFFDRGKVVEVSTNHDSSPVDTLTSNMIQIAENAFAYKKNDPASGDRHTLKIFNYNPETTKMTSIKEFNTVDSSTYDYQLNKAK